MRIWMKEKLELMLSKPQPSSTTAKENVMTDEFIGIVVWTKSCDSRYCEEWGLEYLLCESFKICFDRYSIPHNYLAQKKTQA